MWGNALEIIVIPIMTHYLFLTELKSQLFGLHIWVPHLPVVPACIPFYVQDLYQENNKSLKLFFLNSVHKVSWKAVTLILKALCLIGLLKERRPHTSRSQLRPPPWCKGSVSFRMVRKSWSAEFSIPFWTKGLESTEMINWLYIETLRLSQLQDLPYKPNLKRKNFTLLCCFQLQARTFQSSRRGSWVYSCLTSVLPPALWLLPQSTC